jgi:hypothetical protein
LSDCAAGDIGENIAHKGAVDLQLVKGQTLQVRQRRVAGAEVVQRKTQAARLERGHLLDHVFDVFKQHALRQFQAKVRRVSA